MQQEDFPKMENYPISSSLYNVHDKRVRHQIAQDAITNIQPRFPSPTKMELSRKESQVILTAQTIRIGPNLSARAVAEIYSVSHATLSRRLKVTASQRDIKPKSRRLTNLEEMGIV